MSTVTKDSTNVSRYIMLRDSSDGTPETAYTITNLDLQFTRCGEAPVAKVDATALAATNSAHSDNKAIQIDATSSPGLCRVDWPDAAFATGVDKVLLVVSGAGLDPSVEEIELTEFDLQTAKQKVDLDTVKTQAVTCGAGVTINPQVGQDYKIGVASDGDVTKVNTCATNTDMVGTDGANTTTPPTVDAIADAVLNELTAGHTTPGSLSKAIIDALEDTNELQGTGVTLANGAHGGNSATLILDHLQIISSAHDAILITAIAANKKGLKVASTYDDAVYLEGNQTGHALHLKTNNSGDGLKIEVNTGDVAPEIEAMFDTTETACVAIQAQTDKIQFGVSDRIKSVPIPNSTAIGGDSFMFELSASPTDPRVTGASSNESDVQDLDATKRTTTYTDVSTHTQWQLTATVIQHDPEWTAENEVDPAISYSSSNEAVATVNGDGLVRHVNDGDCRITATSETTINSPAFSDYVDITNSTTGGDTVDIVTYIPDVLDATKHVLILHNTSSPDSVSLLANVKANLPGMTNANTLDLPTVPDSDVMPYADVDSKIYTPVRTWLLANQSAKPIRNIIILRGVPNRDSAAGASGNSISYGLYHLFYNKGDRTGESFIGRSNRYSTAEYKNTTALVSTLDMGSLAATEAYITKVKNAAVTGTQTDGITVSGTDANVAGSHYYFDEKRTLLSYSDRFDDDYDALIDDGVHCDDISYQNSKTGTAITSGSYVIHYASWGKYNSTLGPDWPDSGNIVFSGKSSWWLGMSVESYNGVYGYAIHGDPTEWFAATAFGGTDYANTPICFVGHTFEPMATGVNSYMYPLRWQQDWNASECVWNSRRTGNIVHVGWPFVEN